jgi:myo-inositol-1(or 4)-monophosphatase
MTDEGLHALRTCAEEAARAAGAILRDKFGGVRTIEFKGGIDLVTDADRASERELIAHLRARYPDHAILSEEAGFSRGTGGMRWIVDPLDGTTNYSHRVPHFCVSIAVEGPRGLLAGVVYDPMQDELFAATRGQGATLNGAPLRASDATTIDHALLCTGFPYDVRERPDAPVGLFSRLIRKAQGVRRMGSAALDLAYVASGRFDGFFEFGLKPWDIAAGALLVQEAGGAMRRIDGAPFDLAIGDVLATAPGLEKLLTEECREFLEQIRYVPRARLEPA